MIALGAHHAVLPSAGDGAHEHTAAGQHLIRHAADGLQAQKTILRNKGYDHADPVHMGVDHHGL